LEENAETSDKKRFWECLKSMHDTRKDKDDIPLISEDNWLKYFHSLHSNNRFNPSQQSIMNDNQEEEMTLQTTEEFVSQAVWESYFFLF